MSRRFKSLVVRTLGLLIAMGILCILIAACVYEYLKPSLPDVASLRDIELQTPLRIYTRDGRLMAAIGDERRIPVAYDELPTKLVQAFLATEDDRFFKHHGVDAVGVLRAAVVDLKGLRMSQGASTITMQLSRNMFLNRKRDFKRKISEIYIALLMESAFTKDEIFSLYINKIFLGERAYGVAAAAETYFGKTVDQLSIAEMATLAGIPAAPSVFNPIANASATQSRRAHVLARMRTLHYISDAEYREAIASPVESRLHAPRIEVDAPYVVEMVRRELHARYGERLYTGGYRVYTTVDSRLQNAAVVAVRAGLLDYDRRHGWRGASASIDPQPTAAVNRALNEFSEVGGLRPAMVQEVSAGEARVYLKGTGSVTLTRDKLSWARRDLGATHEGVERDPLEASEVLVPGDVIYTVGRTPDALEFVQVPEVQGALVSLDPRDGAIVALVGGFDFAQSQFNRATLSRRQPGSGFKPFIYAAALDKGFTPASVVLDAPVTYPGWRPTEDDHEFHGAIRLREALAKSRNLVSIRVVRDLGVGYTRNFASRFGFDKSQIPDDLSMALGTASVTPLQMAAGYSIFANGGFKVTPYAIDRIDVHGRILFQSTPLPACARCARRAPAAIRPEVAFLLADMMQDVIRHGTGAAAQALKRDDLSGKTGTTNSGHDAWFNGFNGDLVTSVWTGCDDDRGLGDHEFGASVALPIWVDYMREALAGAPRHAVPMPEGIVSARISPVTGQLAGAEDVDAIMERFMAGHLPSPAPLDGAGDQNPNAGVEPPLF